MKTLYIVKTELSGMEILTNVWAKSSQEALNYIAYKLTENNIDINNILIYII